MLGIDLGTQQATGVWLSASGVTIAALRADPRELLRDGAAGFGLLGALEAVIALPFDATAEQRALAERAGRRAGLSVLGVLTEPVAAVLGRLPAFRGTPRPAALLVLAPGRFASVVEWKGTSVTALASARSGGRDIVAVADAILAGGAIPWGVIADVVVVGDDAEAPGVREGLEARWGRAVVLPGRPDLAVAYGAAKVGMHLRQLAGART